MTLPTLFHIPVQLKLTHDDSMTIPWQQLFTNVAALLNLGVPPASKNSRGTLAPTSITISISKLTSGGANGSLTFTSGILTGYQAPT
jgi:hypothetical protein